MKHGIIISAHNNVEVIRTAMRILDDSRFTFFLHVDAKSEYEPQDFVPELKHSSCVISNRSVVNWGGYSILDTTLSLMEAAVSNQVDMIHYFQGADIPLKTPDQIDKFMEKNRGKNFLDFQPRLDTFTRYKVLCKHFLVDNPRYRQSKILHWLNHGVAYLQKPFMDKRKYFYHGSALFSITREFAEYILEQKHDIYHQYRYSLAADEVYIHTICMNSPYSKTVYEKESIRLIDWKRREGNSPHTYTMDDLELIKAAIKEENWLFSRKFSENLDLEIVKQIEVLVSENAHE